MELKLHRLRVSGILLLLILLLETCKKDNNFTNQYRIKSTTIRTNNGLSYIDHFVYDSIGRLTEDYHDGSNFVIYNYYPDKIIEISQTSLQSSIDTLYLNSLGLVSYTTSGYSYTYDNNGYLLQQIYTHSGYRDTLTNIISNGNEVSYQNDQHQSSSDTYFSRNDTYSNDIDTRYWGVFFLGKSNKNLLRNSSYISSGSNITTTRYSTDYFYRYDNIGRITQVMTISTNNSDTSRIDYTY